MLTASAILEKSLGVPSIIAVLRKPDYEETYRTVGVLEIISLTDVLAHQIMMEIEQLKVKKIMSIGGGKAEIYAVQIPADAKTVGMTIREIAQHKKFPHDCGFREFTMRSRIIFQSPAGIR